MSPTAIYIGEPHLATFSEVTVADVPVNDLTVNYTLKTELGVPVTGGAGSMPFVAGSQGDYAGSLLGAITATLTEFKNYFLEIAYTGSVIGLRRLKLIARYREEF